MSKRTWLAVFLAGLFLIIGGIGCGGEREKGINKDKDRPKPAAAK